MSRKVTIEITEEYDNEEATTARVALLDSDGEGFQERIGNTIALCLQCVDEYVGGGILSALLRSEAFDWLGWSGDLGRYLDSDSEDYLNAESFGELCDLYREANPKGTKDE